MNRKLWVTAGALTCAALLWTSGILVGFRAAADQTSGAFTEIQSSANVSNDAAQEATVSPLVNPLAGTDWRLIEFQSMDDATGTIRPDDPSLYTMRLNSDGTVTMRLNCKRVSGTWSAESSGNGASGRFEFGPLAGTSALCQPPSLDEKFAAQAKFIRSYLLKDGRLYLSLMADGGIYAWEPNTDKSSAASVPAAPEDGGPIFRDKPWNSSRRYSSVNL